VHGRSRCEEIFHMKSIINNTVRLPVAQLVEALRNKEGSGFDFRWCNYHFSMTYPSVLTMALGSSQPLTEMSTRNISWGVKAAGA